MAISIERIADVKNKLGEGPVWDVAEQALYWIDGAAPAIYRLIRGLARSRNGRLRKRSVRSPSVKTAAPSAH